MDNPQLVSAGDARPASRWRVARQRLSIRRERESDGFFEGLMAAGGVAFVLFLCLLFYLMT